MPPCKRNLKLIGLALHTYHEEYGSFPPPVVKNRDGEAMCSWRVLLLPYLFELYESEADWLKRHRYDSGFWASRDVIERERVARRKATQIDAVLAAYDLTQPWDGPKNLPLSNAILEAFSCEHSSNHTGTDYLAVVGEQTAWPENGGIRCDDIRDGLSNTILLVESIDTDIHWSEPRDLRFDEMSFVVNDASRIEINGPFQDAVNVLLADGSVSTLFADITPDDVRALLTIRDEEDEIPWVLPGQLKLDARNPSD